LKLWQLISSVFVIIGILLYLLFIVIPFYTLDGIRWHPEQMLQSSLPFEWLLPLIPWGLLVVTRARYARKPVLILSLAVWISFGAFLLAGVTGVFWVWRNTEQGIGVGNLGVTTEGTIAYANNVVNNSVNALFSGLILGFLVSLAASSLAEVSIRPYLFAENRLLRRTPPVTSVSVSGNRFESEFANGLWKLFRRSLFFAITLSIIYSGSGLPVVLPAQSENGFPVLSPAFVALFFYSPILPAVVHFLEVNDYLIKREGEPNKLYSETIMRWFGIGATLPALVSIFAALPKLGLFLDKPSSIPYAFLTFMPAVFAVLGASLSLEAFLTRQKKVRKIGMLAVLFVAMYRTDFFDRILLGKPTYPIVDWAILFGEFTSGTFRFFGVYWYPLALVAAVLTLGMLLVSQRITLSRDELARLAAGVFTGVVLGLVLPFALSWESLTRNWPIWVPTLQVLNCTTIAYVTGRRGITVSRANVSSLSLWARVRQWCASRGAHKRG
jgi:hypothetical protein